MPTIAEALGKALECHRSGNFQEAERLYRLIIEADPCHVDALQLYGTLAFQTGRAELAIKFLREALKHKSDYAEVHSNLGYILTQQGQLDEAIHHCRQAIQYKPGHAEAHNNLGNALRTLGRWSEAADCYREVIRLKPDYAEAHNALGEALAEQGRLEEAVLSFLDVVRLLPDVADGHNNVGIIMARQGKVEEAAASLQKAVRLKPDYAEAHWHRAVVLQALDRPEAAVAHCRDALRLKPDQAEAYYNLAMALQHLDQHQEAAERFREAIRLKPDYAEAHLNLSLTYLKTGDFEQGWTEYEWRWRIKSLEIHPLLMSRPVWDGSPLVGKTILLHAERALGDNIQFIRYAARVQDRGGRVLLYFCPEALIRLLNRSAGITQAIALGSPLPSYDVHAPLFMLPRLLGTTAPERIPGDIPYLEVDPDLVQRWAARLDALDGFRVGIVWQGDPRQSNFELRAADRRRSFPLAHFEPLARLPGVKLISLQKGFGREQLTHVGERFAVTDLGGMLSDFMDTAAVMMNLDLVISADTSAVHLAGALGVPVWVPLPSVSCWRWMLLREDSPWYPSMRLFRQKQAGDWDEVFERMALELRRRSLAGTAG